MRVVIADDSVLLRAGLARLLEDAGFEVVGQAGEAEDLLRKVRAHKPDVAVTDIRMPPTQTDEGLRAAQQIRTEMPDVGVMVLAQFIDEGYAMELLQGSAEGVGYLLKDRVADVDAFVDALRRVGARGSVLDPEVVAQLLGRRRPTSCVTSAGSRAEPPSATRRTAATNSSTSATRSFSR
jgi:DNA-binding NarL/FixJ family response regulator